jgi:pimeloyl-ACP methyl ester carboxylesterase
MWTSVQRELALLGHRSLAVDLPGHGLDAQYPAAYQAPQDLEAWAAEPSTLAKVSLRDNADLVVDTVRRLAVHGPVVLVGASLGGTAVSVAGNEVPELIDRLVYLSAWPSSPAPILSSTSASPSAPPTCWARRPR